MIHVILYILLICLFTVNSYLTQQQMSYVSKILTYDNINKTFSKEIRKTQEILFYHAKPFAYKKFEVFCNTSRVAKRMYNPKRKLLLYYSYSGLWKAIRNYNGRSNFFNYASIYVDGELKKGLTEIMGSSILPHRLRVNREFYLQNKANYSSYFVKPLSFSHVNIISKSNKHENEDINHIKDILNRLPNRDQQFFTYKYDIYTGKVKMSNRKVSRLMCVSEETARKKIEEAKIFIQENLNKH